MVFNPISFERDFLRKIDKYEIAAINIEPAENGVAVFHFGWPIIIVDTDSHITVRMENYNVLSRRRVINAALEALGIDARLAVQTIRIGGDKYHKFESRWYFSFHDIGFNRQYTLRNNSSFFCGEHEGKLVFCEQSFSSKKFDTFHQAHEMGMLLFKDNFNVDPV